MKRQRTVQSRDTQEALSKIDDAIRSRYPDCTEGQAENIRGKVLNYVGNGLSDGYDVALIKRTGLHTILRVLKLVAEDD
jgi:hypothetical protein